RNDPALPSASDALNRRALSSGLPQYPPATLWPLNHTPPTVRTLQGNILSRSTIITPWSEPLKPVETTVRAPSSSGAASATTLRESASVSTLLYEGRASRSPPVTNSVASANP